MEGIVQRVKIKTDRKECDQGNRGILEFYVFFHKVCPLEAGWVGSLSAAGRLN
jgi:hypothetical protein